MPHQCTRCGKIYPDASGELLKGCSCGARFFYYIKEGFKEEAKEAIVELEKTDKTQIEKDIREITGLDKEPEKPVILDLESVRVIRPGKFEIDIVNLFNKRRPLIYKLEEGKYIIDLAASFKVDKDEVAKKIRDPDRINKEDEIDEEEVKSASVVKVKDEWEDEVVESDKEENVEGEENENIS